MSFARKARRARRGYTPGPSSQFQINPVAYLEAVSAGLCPYDGSRLAAEEGDEPIKLCWCPKCERGFCPYDGSRLAAEEGDEPIKLCWCPKCERGFGPVQSSGDVDSA